jgi:hypothetical protein
LERILNRKAALLRPARYSVARMLHEPRPDPCRVGALGSAHLYYLCSFRKSSERGCHILHGFQRAGAPDSVFRAGFGGSRSGVRKSRTIEHWVFEASVSLRARRLLREGVEESGKGRRGSRTFWRLFSSLPVFHLAFGPKAFLRGAEKGPESQGWSQPPFSGVRSFFSVTFEGGLLRRRWPGGPLPPFPRCGGVTLGRKPPGSSTESVFFRFLSKPPVFSFLKSLSARAEPSFSPCRGWLDPCL